MNTQERQTKETTIGEQTVKFVMIDGQWMTSTTEIAEVFNKEHSKIVSKIKKFSRFDSLILNLSLSSPLSENATLFYTLYNMISPYYDQTSISPYYVRTSISPSYDQRSQSWKGILFVVKGQQNLTLTIPGTDIYRARLQSPFNLHLTLIGEKGGERIADLTVPARYTYQNFESPFPCGFNDTMRAEGVDTNDNGLFEFLRVGIEAFTKTEGNYTIIGELRQDYYYPYMSDYKERPMSGGMNKCLTSDSASRERGADNESRDGSSDEWQGNERPGQASSSGMPYYWQDSSPVYSAPIQFSAPSPGNFSLNLTFNGTSIYLSGYPGSYTLRASIYREGSLVDYSEWALRDFYYNQFESPAVYGHFTGRYTRTPDRAGLNLTVQVSILMEGNYIIGGYAEQDYEFTENLNLGQAPLPVYKFPHLSPGLHNISLFFRGDMRSFYASSFQLTLTTLSTGGKDTLFIASRIKPISMEPGTGEQRINFTPTDKGTITDKGIDRNGDGKYEFLHIEIKTNLPAGNYSCLAILYPGQSNDMVISTVSFDFQIPEGGMREMRGEERPEGRTEASFVFDFPGEDIYLSGMNGLYRVRIFATSENVEHTFQGMTRKYRFTDFSAVSRQSQGPEPRFEMENESLFVHSDVFASRVLKNVPEFSFFYYTDMGQSMKFRVRFTRLVVFNDRNGNEIYDPDEENDGYQAFLSTRDWHMGAVNYGMDTRMGSYITFNMTTEINLEPVNGGYRGSAVRNWGTLTLEFLMASKSVNGTDINIRGGEEMKVTVSITQNSPLTLPVNRIALEQTITSEENNHLNTEILRGQGIIFQQRNGKAMASYLWEEKANMLFWNGTERQANVGSSVHTENSTTTLTLTYPLSTDTAGITHDPSAGVFRENAPYPEIAGEEKGSVTGYLGGIIVVGAAVLATLYYQGMRWQKGNNGKNLRNEYSKGKKLN